MKNIYFAAISVLTIISCSCIERDVDRSKSAFSFILNEVITGKYGSNFGIYSQINEELNDSIMKYDLYDYALKFKFDLDLLNKQYKELKGKNIKDFVPSYYYGNIRSEISNEYPIFFKFGPPLFNDDNSSFVMYFRIFFIENEKLKWTHQYFICEKSEGKWKLKGWLDLDRDK